MFHVCIAHCIPEKIHKMSKRENSCLFVWSTVSLYFVFTSQGQDIPEKPSTPVKKTSPSTLTPTYPARMKQENDYVM